MMGYPLVKDRATGLARRDKTCMHVQTDVSLLLSSDPGLIDRAVTMRDLAAAGSDFSAARADRVFPLAVCVEDFGLGFSSLTPLSDLVMPDQPAPARSRSGNIVSL